MSVVLDTTEILGIIRAVLKELNFDWDQWNLQKNEAKHGVSRLEAESVFFDPANKIFKEEKHSRGTELRYVLYGKSLEARILMLGFTIRKDRIRIITARTASRKERAVYAK